MSQVATLKFQNTYVLQQDGNNIIPFDVSITKKKITRKSALANFKEMRRQVADVSEMTLEEINAEISEVRLQRKATKL